jgi:hypothetical protein
LLLLRAARGTSDPIYLCHTLSFILDFIVRFKCVLLQYALWGLVRAECVVSRAVFLISASMTWLGAQRRLQLRRTEIAIGLVELTFPALDLRILCAASAARRESMAAWPWTANVSGGSTSRAKQKRPKTTEKLGPRSFRAVGAGTFFVMRKSSQKAPKKFLLFAFRNDVPAMLASRAQTTRFRFRPHPLATSTSFIAHRSTSVSLSIVLDLIRHAF